MTLSIGFRAPAHADIITGFTDSVASKLGDELRYSDPYLNLQQHPGEISSEALQKVHEIIRSATSNKNSAIDSWFGRFITEPKSGEPVTEPEQTLTPKQFLSLFKEHGTLERSEYARFAFISQDGGSILFVDGQDYPLSNKLTFAAPLLCDQRQYSYTTLADRLAQSDFSSLLTEFYNAGYVIFIE